ncbi:MAG TPA: Fe2+-dependent dioxygenase [Allosphingosinicella sp.]|jgi:PKHD-type hydroxylase
MLIAVPQLLPRDSALALRERLLGAEWVDGNVTSGEGAALAKRNRQLPEAGGAARQGREQVSAALASNPIFLSAALPRTIFPPLFNRYGPGDRFDAHVDNAIRVEPATGRAIRTDLSATLFLSDPGDYEGGELEVSGRFGTVRYKLEAGDLLLYSSSSLHNVTPVTRGDRVSAFFWLQSLVRDDADREMLFDLDQVVQRLTAERGGDDAEVLRLTQLYHNLIRRWAEL